MLSGCMYVSWASKAIYIIHRLKIDSGKTSYLKRIRVAMLQRNNRNKYWQPNPLFNLVIPKIY